MNANNGRYHGVSISQEHHLLHHTLDVLTCPGEVEGVITPARMQQALRYVVSRHPELRARFIIENGRVRRELFHVDQLPLKFVNKTGASSDELKSFLISFEKSQRETLPKRHEGPLFSCAFIQSSPNSSIFLLTIDHIIADAWSIKLFSDALFTAYEQIDEIPKTATEVHEDLFGEFAEWQRCKINQSASAIAANWSQKPTSSVELKTEGPLIKRELILSAQTTQSLLQAAQSAKMGLFTFLLTAMNLLLANLSIPVQEVRMVHSGRFRHKWKSAIGLFASSLSVDLPAIDRQDLAGLLKSTHRSFYRAIKWSYVPIEYVQTLRPEHTSSSIEIDYIPLDLFKHPGKLLQINTLLDVTLQGLQPDLNLQLLCYPRKDELHLFFIMREHLCKSNPDHITACFEEHLIQLMNAFPQKIIENCPNT